MIRVATPPPTPKDQVEGDKTRRRHRFLGKKSHEFIKQNIESKQSNKRRKYASQRTTDGFTTAVTEYYKNPSV